MEGGLQMGDVRKRTIETPTNDHSRSRRTFRMRLKPKSGRLYTHFQNLPCKFISSKRFKQYSASSPLHICDCASIGN